MIRTSLGFSPGTEPPRHGGEESGPEPPGNGGEGGPKQPAPPTPPGDGLASRPERRDDAAERELRKALRGIMGGEPAPREFRAGDGERALDAAAVVAREVHRQDERKLTH
ncbi:hypothetical protein Ani05nite_07200 [Amorphoplanes nipponensis]|uniref:Uncharacterized protein n=1 Tax=Actinoplanes nipponensis TaxID=135950 RepID=A0A919JBA2_9ACTN|nr:hypothetical protein Ani05nite_07200 [Actinoplanes nipponensis]